MPTNTCRSWRNVTNQPLFSDGTNGKCDSVVRVPGTKLSTGANKGVQLNGDVAILQAFYPITTKKVWSGAWGFKVDQAYYERPQQACANLKGFNVVSAPA